MSETRTRPRIEAEELPAPRLEQAQPLVPLAPEPALRPRPKLALAGTATLALGLPALWAAGFVADQFNRSAALGWIGLLVAVAGFGLLGAASLREFRALLSLRTVDRLRADLASGDLPRMRAAARAWLASLPDHDALLPAIAAADTPETLLALLHSGPGATLRARTDALSRTAAVQAGAIVAATPSPALDALTVGWRGLRLVRQVAALHGLRPGTLGTLALLRRTATAAASVAATELAVNAAAHAVLSNKLLQHVLGDVAGAGVAARRMVVLARACATACSPLP